jgi:hypothetical protein
MRPSCHLPDTSQLRSTPAEGIHKVDRHLHDLQPTKRILASGHAAPGVPVFIVAGDAR